MSMDMGTTLRTATAYDNPREEVAADISEEWDRVKSSGIWRGLPRLTDIELGAEIGTTIVVIESFTGRLRCGGTGEGDRRAPSCVN
jgi:hypothetical protein